MTTTRSFLAFAIAALVLAGGAVFARSTPAAPTKSGPARASVSVGKSNYGQILFDGRGYALYGFTSDSRNHARCYGACAKGWPPYIVKARPVAGKGVQASRLGVMRRADGKLQATYAGRPLYYYVGDNAPGVVLCQNVKEYGGRGSSSTAAVPSSGKSVR